MPSREEEILEAAMRLFLRYGVRRTGMSDIAAEASISRQTLYNAFGNKNAVLQGIIRLLADRVIADIEAGLETTDDLGEQLDIIFQHIAIEHFDLMHATPNAEDIVAGFNASSREELAEGAKRNTAVLTRILAPHAAAIGRSGVSVEQLADFVERSATAAKYSARDREHLLDLLTALRAAVLSTATHP